MKNSEPKVLMIGPDRKANGGISTVVNQYFGSNIENVINVKYIATMTTGNLKKTASFIKGYFSFCKTVSEYDIVHIHMSKKGSFYRKYLFARKTKNKGKKLIIHMHSSQFLDFYENSGSSIRRRINKLFQIADRVIVLTEYWKKNLNNYVIKISSVYLEMG